MNLSTRDFIKISGGAVVVGAVEASFAAQKRTPYTGPKVRIAAIGTSRRGSSDLHAFLRTGKAEIVCAADVYAPAMDWVKKEQPKARCFTDYRVMLKECAGKFDAVSIAIPDHTHCVAFFEALKYKVPVFCEKPLGHTFVETVAMMKAARQSGIITHVGMQGNSYPTTPMLREWCESGELGQAREAHLYCNSLNYFYCEPPAWIDEHPAVPAGLDWELWQGPVGTRLPYFRNVAPGGHWRCWYPYGEGCLTDWVCHILGPLVTALDLDLPTAVSVDATDWDPAKTPYSFPLKPCYKFEFPAKGKREAFVAYWYDVNRTAPRPEALEPGQDFDNLKHQWSGAWVKFDKETVMYGSHGATGLRIVPHTRMKAFKRPPQKYRRVGNHHEEFLNAILEKRPSNTPFELGGKVTLIGLLGTVATRFPGRRLEFDAQKMCFTNCEEANKLLRPDWSAEAMAAYGSML